MLYLEDGASSKIIHYYYTWMFNTFHYDVVSVLPLINITQRQLYSREVADLTPQMQMFLRCPAKQMCDQF